MIILTNITNALIILIVLGIALYSVVYEDKVHALTKKIPIPLSPGLSLALKINVIITWALVLFILALLLG